jgi:hypothetical protein
MIKLDIQLFAEGGNPAETNTGSGAGTTTKTPEQIEAERVAKEKADAEVKAKEEAEKARNAEEARKRRERERQEEIDKAKAEAKVQSIIEAVGTNPYTDEELKDATDVDQYLLMKKIEKDGGDPIKDYPKYLKKQIVEGKKVKDSEKEVEDFIAKDREVFAKEHPSVKLDTLFNDEAFMEYADGKIGRLPLSKIYTNYQNLTSKQQKAIEEAVKKAKAEAEEALLISLGKKQATPGSVGSTGSGESFYTKEQLANMSLKEINKNLDKVNKSYEKIRKEK